jgi:phage pi2 protein 07
VFHERLRIAEGDAKVHYPEDGGESFRFIIYR